ncbi:hypothetical protein MTBBW1_2130022 [Desulfamplus magnetovallimortis]|uniref:Uncharacterized protein n=1 Tax=Desulfamplus magnetovallimortis TaxID=1246637 RepID=A0A1W1HCB2_9BACT|nr:hypothetical protein MTBBW1_2130022 [Desulfamplus magnetovallimortis]
MLIPLKLLKLLGHRKLCDKTDALLTSGINNRYSGAKLLQRSGVKRGLVINGKKEIQHSA